jgi:outer membrane protein OmpA-like peptidoglycan-associated protein
VLDEEAEKLKARRANAPPVVVEGHTDSTGDPAYNQDLAERRAEVVRDYLVSHGVNGTKVTVESAGPDKPAADNDTPEGRAENRRVEIEVAPSGATPVTAPLTPRILVPEPSP